MTTEAININQNGNLSANSVKSSSSMLSSTTSTISGKGTEQSTSMLNSNSAATEDYLNKKIAFIQNHINNLLIEITNLPEPWTYAVTEDGRVFFINEDEKTTTWLHPKTGQPVSVMIIPPIEDLPNGWQKDYIYGLPYLIDHNTKQNFLISALTNTFLAGGTTNSTTTTTNNNNNNINCDTTATTTTTNYSDFKMRSPSKSSINMNSSNNNNNNSTTLNLVQNNNNNELSSLKQNSNSVDSAISETNITSGSSANSSLSNPNNNMGMEQVSNGASVDSALRKYGWLYKLSQNGLKLWRKRYFVLTDYILDYYSDSTMSKHCGTIFLNDTHSRPTIKKDGSSAYNKKNSFKVELIQSDDKMNGNSNSSDMYVYLSADSSATMNEWINKFNFVSKLKNNCQNRGIYEKRPASNRSASNTSIRSNNNTSTNGSYFMIKHDNSTSKSKSSKSNSAPNSPNLSTKSKSKSSNNQNTSINTTILRSSMSSSSNMNRSDDKSKKNIKKKLAFSDDEILNDRPSRKSNLASDNDTDYEFSDRLNSSYNSKLNSSLRDKHKRSSSLTKTSTKSNQSSLSARGKNGSTNIIYDYKSIYDAFEKPIDDMAKLNSSSMQINSNNAKNGLNNYSSLKSSYHAISDLANSRAGSSTNSFKKYDQNDFYFEHKPAQKFENYIDKDKIAAAAAAASAAAAAMKKEKDKEVIIPIMNKSQSAPQPGKVVNNFYMITKAQIESLPKNELQMLIRQLRRNFVLLNHSLQRFSLLHKLYEPYEFIYQHRQNQAQSMNNKQDEQMSINELTMCLHDSYQTMKDRVKKIELKMDTIENSLKIAQQYENIIILNSDDNDAATTATNKFANLLKLYEYQVVEMQHEYELLLEDKIIVDKLLDNQMRIFTKYKNLSNEKTLIQQFNALNQEMDLLQIQLSKVNQLLNDTIVEKCKQELIYEQQKQHATQKAAFQNQHPPPVKSRNIEVSTSSSSKNDTNSLFRASLVPVGGNLNGNPLIGVDSKSASSIWKTNSPSSMHKKLIQSSAHFSSIDNLANDYNHEKQQHQPTLSHQQSQQDLKTSSSFQPNQQYQYYLNQNQNTDSDLNSYNSKLDNNMSKSIDSIYSPPTTNSTKSNTLNSNGAFNPAKKSSNPLEIIEDQPTSFQPVNFTNNRPKQLNIIQQQSQQSIQQLQALNQQIQQQQQQQSSFIAKGSNFKRDIIAEKKRSSIGKYQQSYTNGTSRAGEYFQPIPIQHVTSQQSARERLFGNNNLIQNQQNLAAAAAAAAEAEQMNNRKIAMVKPELRGNCENEMMNRFTQQNQMEYFDADYSEEIVKNIQKPEVFAIPRGNIEIEPDVELTEDEKRAKEKRMMEIKKMIALQSLQQLNIDDSNGLTQMHNYNSYQHQDFNFEKEKKARERLLDLRHELAEQIKEKTRQAANMVVLNGSNGPSSLSPSSVEMENRITESSKQSSSSNTPNLSAFLLTREKELFREQQMGYSDQDQDIEPELEYNDKRKFRNFYNMQNGTNGSLMNSTPGAPPTAFHPIYNIMNTSINVANLLN